MITRRGLIGLIIAAPAIVRAESLMPVRRVPLYRGRGFIQLTSKWSPADLPGLVEKYLGELGEVP